MDRVEKGFRRAGEAPFLRLVEEEDEDEEEENRLGRTVSEILDWAPRLLGCEVVGGAGVVTLSLILSLTLFGRILVKFLSLVWNKLDSLAMSSLVLGGAEIGRASCRERV